ncbi:hypothetical protein J6X13_01935 [Candidatus Saccharibacteria bacterium]|nr:hypothetical protein [Candidatus Saccharibacteria bacterium]
MPTDTSLRIAGQHFERALQILDDLEGAREMNAENISNIAKLRAHLSAGTNNVGKFFEKKQDEAYPDEVMGVIYNANGELKVAIAYIDTIAMWHVAINDLPKKQCGTLSLLLATMLLDSAVIKSTLMTCCKPRFRLQHRRPKKGAFFYLYVFDKTTGLCYNRNNLYFRKFCSLGGKTYEYCHLRY